MKMNQAQLEVVATVMQATAKLFSEHTNNGLPWAVDTAWQMYGLVAHKVIGETR